jgi:hypothetical protein
MPDRNMPDPRAAFAWTLTDIKRDVQVMQSRQHWPGRTMVIDSGNIPGIVRTSFGGTAADFQTVASLQLAAGSWTVHGRVIFSIENSNVVANFTGREAVQVRVLVAHPETLVLYEEIDVSYASPSSTPEPAYSSGFLDLPMPVVGYVRWDEPFALVVLAQAWDAEGTSACTWRTKMVAVPA